MRETHRAMNLMRLLSDYSDGFSNPRLPGRNLYKKSLATKRIYSRIGGSLGSRHFGSNDSKRVLNRLKLAYRSTKLKSVRRKQQTQIQH